MTNSDWGKSFISFWETPIGLTFGSMDFTRSLKHWIGDGLMTLFFFLVALELKRELVLGELNSFKIAALPLAGALGGMFVPALIYLILTQGSIVSQGWGVVMATDTAFVVGCLALLGSKIPGSLRLYLLSLAVFDDIGAILIVAFGYKTDLNWLALGLGVLGFGLVSVLARLGMRSVPVYSFIGIAIWLCFDSSGIHTTVAGVILGLMTPAKGWVSDARLRTIFKNILSYPPGDHWSGDSQDRKELYEASTAARETLSPIERIELNLHPWVGFFIMPLFALANAGVAFSQTSFNNQVTLAVIAGLCVGKPLGVFVMSWLSVRAGFAKSFPNLTWPLIAGGSMLTGIGFTMSLFIAELAFPTTHLSQAKMGIMVASLISVIGGMSVLYIISRRKD